MRKLNDLEKEVSKVLVSHRHGTEQGMVQIATIVNDNFMGPKHEISLMVISKKNQVAISIPEKEVKKLQEKFLTVITVFNVLQYLTNEGLILIVGEEATQGALGDRYKDGQTIFVPEPIASFISENITKYIVVTEEFKDIVNSNFKDNDQIRHQQTLAISVVAIIISMLLGLYGVFNSYTNGEISDVRYEQVINNTNKIESAVIALKAKPIDYLTPLKEVTENLESISKEVTLLTQKNFVVKTQDVKSTK